MSEKEYKLRRIYGAPNRGGVGSNGNFRPISRYISETVQDRDIVTMER